jgi:hypothetical protein
VFLTMGENGTSTLATAWIAMIAFVVFAFGILVHSEMDRHKDKRVRVFDLAKEYRVTLRSTNAQFSDRWNEYLNDSVDPYNNGNLDEQAYTDLVGRFLGADSNRDNYEALAGFYDSVGECVDEGLCDFWYARTIFGTDMVTFYHNFYPQLDADNRQGQSDAGIVDFVNRMRDADRGALRQNWEDRAVAWTY